MSNPFKSEISTGIGLMLARLPIGALFVLKGWEKVHNIGATQFVAAHITKVPKYMPPWFPKVYLTTVPYAELAFGIFFILGLLTRVSGFFASLMLVSFIMVVGLKDTNPDLNSAWPFHPNLVYLATTLLLFFAGPGKISVDGWLFGKKVPKAEWD